jgi:Flagellar hook-length control protein FliK
MPISVNPILPVLAAQGAAAPELVLQPGTVVDAKVLQLLADNLVRIAIANISIDVLSQVPLQAGQTLQLAVSQTEGSFRLALVGQGAGAAAGNVTDTVSLAPGALADSATNPATAAAPLKGALTPLARLAVATAAQSAVTRQGSQSQLFANLGVAATGGLPQKLQQAVMQLLAQRTSLDQNLTGGEIKNAFQKSGLFLEAALASGSPAAGVPDLKAALIVLRQTLVTSLGAAGPAAQGPAAQGPVAQGPAVSVADDAAAPPLAPSLSSDIDTQEILSPQLRLPVADVLLGPNGGVRAATAGAALSMLQELLQNGATSLVTATPREAPRETPRDLHGNDVTFHANTPPPPPFRGGQPSAQPVALPSIASDAPLATTAHHLLADTDAAIARQTLLQIASLPDRVDTAGVRIDSSAPRWNFEIPFVTPQGTAMAQFEVSRDGGGDETEAAKRVWRARFSLDVEPAGPVHALVSLTGDTTSVRMWAERPATAEQLRAGAAQLSHALSKAELTPGDIVIRDGTPPQSQPAPAGHFLDRAL